ncbi:oxidoreductase [Actinomyces sp. 432]|uniref:NADH:flavin oxidoreductase/NADH oxidase n=1 Tax=Actinomyces sp. 432 TaxID=2057798 RepID=UPI00137455BF|nr:NADH:flavin oxidoreductase/NADH oxidase [Actinomyces sp. 432]QHO90491.1 oxidoreductase [Actinomyces sp. 432]
MANPMLLQPLSLRGLTARNRLWLPPMCMYSVVTEDGIPGNWHALHYGTRAQGGFGTIIVEASAVTPEGRLSPNDLGLWDDAQIAGHEYLVKAIHIGGALAGVQLGHGGRKAGTPPWRPDVDGARSGTLPGWDLVAPTTTPYPAHAAPRALTTDEIADTVQAFAAAARRAVAAGYDVIELHGAHGYLIHQFLSPLSNTRTDAYGGSDEGRRRFALEVVRAVREAIGDDKVLDIRLSATDWAEGGVTGEQTAELAQQLVQAGVDVLHVSTGGNVPTKVPVGPGYQVPYAAQVKQAVAGMTTPGGGQPQVVTVGIIDSGLQAEQILVAGLADAVAAGRPALRDPYLPVRWSHELGVNDWQAVHLPVQYWRGAWR